MLIPPALNAALRVLEIPSPDGDSEFIRDLERLSPKPGRLQNELAAAFSDTCDTVLVRGVLERRLLLIERNDGQWAAAELSGRTIGTRSWPTWMAGHLVVADPEAAASLIDIDDDAVRRLRTPKILIAALYHPEYFPLPRFPLGISDLARAARSTLMGEVELVDMQLGESIASISATVEQDAPDILGVSATFGQHDLMIELLDNVHALPTPPRIIAGGSLTIRNERMLLERYPHLLIARAAGEATITDLIAHWHGDLPITEVRGLGYVGAAYGGGLSIGLRHTPGVANSAAEDFLPELDLLDDTLDQQGVAQGEASRGCVSACSFCPRGHKGQWSGADAHQLASILPEIDASFRRHPATSRTLYLVDEEFIGRGADAVQRALSFGTLLSEANFRWETSCRIEQVAQLRQDRAWHIERADMWRTLVKRGLRRCLFGVESGVDTILSRFNKETTTAENVLAIRTLSALGVPTRFTYITFDPLMTLEELEASAQFQARTDLLLRPLPELGPGEIVDGVRDEDFVAEHRMDLPFHSAISYMLVSMECLIGAAYTRNVQAAGLAGPPRPAMGRLDASYRDWRIGLASERAQRWVDRNFALDYTLKSLEKVLDGEPRRAVRQARVVLKSAAYDLLKRMIELMRYAPKATGSKAPAALEALLGDAADQLITRLQTEMSAAIDSLLRELPPDRASVLQDEFDRWLNARTWDLINAAEACAT